MPANLTPQYLEAEQAFKEAKTTAEKIAALEEMLAVIPKHKGTEKLQADIKRRLSKLREEGERKAKTGRQDPFLIERHGAGQVVLVGFPNSGKSAIVGALTRAKVTVAEYPFSTALPLAGMMQFEDIWIQLVDMPPVTEEEMPAGMSGALRNADALLIVVDVSSDDCLDQLEGVLRHLREKRILRDDCEMAAGVRGHTLTGCMVAATKIDLPRSRDNLEILKEYVPPALEMVPVSVASRENVETLRRRVFDLLGIIRIYTKVPGKPPDMGQPFVLKRGSSVVDMAAAVHRDFPSKLKSARIWGSARFDGQSVPRDYILHDRDIVELHV
ncbi:MAG: 50S ribosome-binding GTPase [Bacillota bacterium]|nr:50S ribosome-binding GTPase [Bacillota bacterium]